jgi:chemotaxis protein methyltransferase CheR
VESSPDDRTREFELTAAEYSEICQLVRSHTGITLSDNKRELVYSRLTRRLRRLGMRNFRQYIELLASGDPVELEEFTNAITTNLTAFFREEHHFDHLIGDVLPELAVRNAATRRIRIWSAGCSTGEEPYSIAMSIHENMSRFPGWDIKILATDLDSNVVAHASAGIYGSDRVEKMRPDRLRTYFDKTLDDKWAVDPCLKALITFKQLNLMHEWPMRGPFDAIFCRNVVIYFDKPTQRELFDRMANIQVSGAHLFIGHSESLFKVTERYKLIGRTVYQKVT